jgi:hypothetical protein
LKDLEDDFAPGCKFTTSEPMLPFKETIANRKLKNIQEKKKKFEENEGTESEEEEMDLNRYMEFVAEKERNR